jgi:hypothetical protein
VVEDTNKQKKETSINGNTESVTHSLNQQTKEETSKKSHSSYGFDGLIQIFHKLDIDITDWIIEPLDKERGGFVFMLPNSEGDIYLTWEDMYSVDVTFVNTKANYKEVVTLPTLEVLIQTLEEQRQRTVAGIRDMLKEKFSGK